MKALSRKRTVKKITTIFWPIVERCVHAELKRLVAKPVPPEVIDEWMRLVGNSSAGRFLKSIAMRRLRSFRELAERGECISLKKREEAKIIAKATDKIASLFADTAVNLLILPVDDGFLVWKRVEPVDVRKLRPSEIPSFDDRLSAFGITEDRFYEAYRTCVTALLEQKQ